jgi:hypothetical protein
VRAVRALWARGRPHTPHLSLLVEKMRSDILVGMGDSA